MSRRVTPNTRWGYRTVKRTADIVGSIFSLLLLSPIFIIIAVAIYAEDHGKVLFKQKRAGLNNSVFVMYKFRSMVPNAAMMRKDMEQFNELDGPAFKMKNDPRITKVGKFLRRTSLDELPQLVNILKGDMSFVGPRPLPTYESELCNSYQLQRLLVKPGLTCYWQISGRSDISFEEWMEMDLRYIEKQSLLTDVIILLNTFKAVLGKRGAY